jgi:hypothetical protein
VSLQRLPLSAYACLSRRAERERKRARERERARESARERERARESESERERARAREKEIERARERERERERDFARQRVRERDRQIEMSEKERESTVSVSDFFSFSLYLSLPHARAVYQSVCV